MEQNFFKHKENEGGKTTTIKLLQTTKQRLDHLRSYRRETYDEILQKMLEILNVCRLAPERARLRLVAIDKQRKQIASRKEIRRFKDSSL